VSPRGIFLTFEGPDGAGKSTQAHILADRIRATGRDVVVTREPGGTALGEKIRAILLDSSAESHDALSDALLFNAARSRQVSEIIKPALDDGRVVICDRFSDSTLAYQGYGGGVPIESLRTLASIAIGDTVPDRTVLTDLSVEEGLARRRAGDANGLNRFETDASKHDAAFHQRVRDGYLLMAWNDPVRWRIINGAQELEQVAASAWSAVADLFAD
jgi:dTMP kinase